MIRLSDKESRTLAGRTKIKSFSIIVLIATFALSALWAPVASADRFDDQINSLSQDNAVNRSSLGGLDAQERDLASTVAALQSQITALEGQIRVNENKRTEISQKIAEAEAEIAQQRQILGVNIKQMYLDDQMTMGEMLATSKDLGEFVDKEQYRLAVQSQIRKTMERISQLRKEMDEQRATIDKLLVDQTAMQSELAAQRAESDRLLNLNQAQQAALNGEITENNARIASLKRQQAAENSRNFVGAVSYGGTGSYPWANAPFPNTLVDPWGMYQRQCVSYTAWKVASTGRYMPYWGGRGNAKNWDDNARAAGIPVDGTPRVGDVAVSNAGTYGHVMYVEAVHSDGTISISQYNASWDGKYSEGRRSTAGLVFIHF